MRHPHRPRPAIIMIILYFSQITMETEEKEYTMEPTTTPPVSLIRSLCTVGSVVQIDRFPDNVTFHTDVAVQQTSEETFVA